MKRNHVERYQHQLWSPFFAFPTERYDIRYVKRFFGGAVPGHHFLQLDVSGYWHAESRMGLRSLRSLRPLLSIFSNQGILPSSGPQSGKFSLAILGKDMREQLTDFSAIICTTELLQAALSKFLQLPGSNLLSLRSICLFSAKTETMWPGRTTKSCCTSRKAGFLPSSITEAVKMSSFAGSQGTTRWSIGIRELIFRTTVNLAIEKGLGAMGNLGSDDNNASCSPPPTKHNPSGLKITILCSGDNCLY